VLSLSSSFYLPIIVFFSGISPPSCPSSTSKIDLSPTSPLGSTTGIVFEMHCDTYTVEYCQCLWDCYIIACINIMIIIIIIVVVVVIIIITIIIIITTPITNPSFFQLCFSRMLWHRISQQHQPPRRRFNQRHSKTRSQGAQFATHTFALVDVNTQASDRQQLGVPLFRFRFAWLSQLRLHFWLQGTRL
jgi:hypothetical protein